MVKIEVNPSVKFTIIISAVAFLFIPVKFVQMIVLAVIFFILTSYTYVKSLAEKLTVDRTLTTVKLSNHEQFDISLVLKNYSRLPVFACFVSDDCGSMYVYGKGNIFLCSLHSRELKTFHYRILAQERGEFYIGPVTIRFSDPFNLFTVTNTVDSKVKIIVRPARVKLGVELFPGLPQGNLKINNICYEDITMRKSIREYKPGDELKRINWRASAKFNQLFTNEYLDTFDVPVFVFVNLANDDYDLHLRRYKGERALEIAAAVVERISQLHLSCGFAAYGSGFPYLKPAQNQTDFILDILSTIKMEDGKLDYNPEETLKSQLPFGTLLYVIGPKEAALYDDMEAANRADINTTNLNVVRKLWK